MRGEAGRGLKATKCALQSMQQQQQQQVLNNKRTHIFYASAKISKSQTQEENKKNVCEPFRRV